MRETGAASILKKQTMATWAPSTIPLHPLAEFYPPGGPAPPRIEVIDGAAMPEPQRRLLVHLDDMTPTLEAYCGTAIHLRVLERRLTAGTLSRRVVLLAGEAKRPIEFGAIRIHLDGFAEEPRREILENRRPLGAILSRYGVEHGSKPTCFFRLTADAAIAGALGLGGAPTLYGRQNVLCDRGGRTLAEVVEILPPLEGAGRG